MKVYILQDALRGGGTERQGILLTRTLIDAGLTATLLVGYAGGALDSCGAEILGRRMSFLTSGGPFRSASAFFKLRRLVSDTPNLLICMARLMNGSTSNPHIVCMRPATGQPTCGSSTAHATLKLCSFIPKNMLSAW